MKAKLVVPIVLLGAILGLVALLLDRPSSDSETDGASVEVERADPAASGAGGAANLAEVESGQPGRETKRAPAEAPTDVDPNAADGDDAVPTSGLTVQVEWPTGIEPVDGLVAYVFRRDVPTGNLARTFVSMEGADGDGEPSIFDELEDPNLKGSAIREALLAEAPVEMNVEGAWGARVDVPSDRSRVFVHALGGGAYTEHSVEVFLPADSVTIRPVRGASLELVVTPAEGVDGVDLTATRVRVRPKQDGANMMAMGSTEGSRFGANVLLDEQGRVTLPTVPAGMPLDVEIRSDEFAPIDLVVPAIAMGETREVEATALRGARISGRVTDEEGREVGGARVTASIPGQIFGFDDDVVAESTADIAGRFTLEHLPDGMLVVRADADDALESSRVRVEIVDATDADDVVIALDQGRSITGTVRYENGGPGADLDVRAQFDITHIAGPSGLGAMRGAKARTMSDEDGRFTLEGLGSGPFSIRASATVDGDDGPLWQGRLDGIRPGAEDVDLVLRPPLGVSGVVLDESGSPLADLQVIAARVVPGSMGDVRLDYHASRSDDSGRFTIDDLTAGDWVLSVSTEEYVSLVETTVEVTTNVTGAEVRAVRTGSVSGIVVDPEGTPVPEAVVEQVSDLPDWQKALAREVPASRTRTKEDGTFLLLAVRPGTIRLTAQTDDMSPASADAIELDPGAVVEDVELRLGRGGTIEGVCFDAEGKTAAGRLVTVQSASLSLMRSMPTDEDGSFIVRGLPTGSYQIVAMDPSGDTSGDLDGAGIAKMFESLNMANADVVEGETTVVFLGAPPADPVDVSGRVEQGGEPFAGAMVSWLPASRSMYEQMKMAVTDEDGNYSLTLDEPGDYIVSVARLSGGTGQQETVEFSEEVPDGVESHDRDFEIPGGVIAGRVIGPDGEPLAGSRVTIMSVGSVRTDRLFGGSYAEIPTSAQGTFEATGLRPGEYQVAAGGAAIFGASKTAPARTIVGGINLGENQRIEGVEIRLPDPGSLEVTVRDSAGVAVAGATVFLRDEQGRHTELFSMVTTDSNGATRITGLAPGSYTVAARTNELASQESAPVDVVAGETGSADVLLDSGATIIAILKAKGDASIPAASIQVLDSQGRDVTRRIGLTDIQTMYADAEFSMRERRIGPVPMGRYKVLATTEDGRSAKRNVTVDSPGLRRVSLVLR